MVNFFVEDVQFSLDNKNKVIDWLNYSIEKEGYELGELSFIFCSDQYLLKINQDHLKHDFFTDIITFDYKEGKIIGGDIFISIDRVNENAEALSQLFQNELLRVIIHGVLHIIGYKDKSPEEETLMRSKEDFYLSLRTF